MSLQSFKSIISVLLLIFCQIKIANAESLPIFISKANKDIFPLSQSAQLNAVFSTPELIIPQADYVTHLYVMNPRIPRSVKVKELWALAIKYQHDEDKFWYLVDGLAILKPLEISPELIQYFQAERNPKNQYHLLRVLAEILEDQHPSILSHEQLLNVAKIKHFFEDLLKTSADKDILERAIQEYASIFPPEKAEHDIAKALARKDIAHLQPLLPDKEKMFIDLDLAFATPKQQQKNLPQLMKAQFNEKQKTIFNFVLCSRLNIYGPKWIDDNVRDILKQFLLKNKSLLSPISYAIDPISDLYQLRPEYVNLLPPCYWLDAYATVMTHNEIEKRQFILNYIHNEKDVFAQAALLVQNWRQISHLSKEEKLYYRTKFENALKQTNMELSALISGILAINSKPIAKALASKDIAPLQPLIPNKQKMFIDLDLAFATPKQQQKKLSQLMKSQFNENQQNIFNIALCSRLNIYSPKRIDDNIRDMLKQFLLKNKSSLFSISYAIEPLIYVYQHRPEYINLPLCYWLDAYATVMTHNEIEKRQFIINYVHDEKNVFIQAALLSQNWKQISPLSEKGKLHYRTRFENTEKEIDTQRKVLMLGLSYVNERSH